jgi:hypothetical protein
VTRNECCVLEDLGTICVWKVVGQMTNFLVTCSLISVQITRDLTVARNLLYLKERHSKPCMLSTTPCRLYTIRPCFKVALPPSTSLDSSSHSEYESCRSAPLPYTTSSLDPARTQQGTDRRGPPPIPHYQQPHNNPSGTPVVDQQPGFRCRLATHTE